MKIASFLLPLVYILLVVVAFGQEGKTSVVSEEAWTGEVRSALSNAVKHLKSVDSGQVWSDEVQSALSEAEKRLKSAASGLVRVEEIQKAIAEAAKQLKSTNAIGAAREAEVRSVLSDAGMRLISTSGARAEASGGTASGAAESDVASSLSSSPPTVTPIKGGYYVHFPQLTEVGSVQLGGTMTGKLEISFDNRLEDIGIEAKRIDNPEFLLVLADYWIVRGKPERAIPLYELGLEKDPANFLFQNNLALLVSTAVKDHEKALNIIDGALKDRADNVTLLDTKGLILINAKRSDEAATVLQRAVELSCQKPLCVMHYAYALDMQGQEAAAREWFNKAQPLLESSTPAFLKEDKSMYDYLKMKYTSGPTFE